MKKTIHETAKGLRDAELMTVTTLREFDALCLPSVKNYSARQIKLIRNKVKASQGVFAVYLNTSISTIQKWEAGQKKPNGPFIEIIEFSGPKRHRSIVLNESLVAYD